MATRRFAATDPNLAALWVNRSLRQRADLKDLICGVGKLPSYVSTVMTLYPGDIVTTGTPEGVGAVHDGDAIVVKVTGLDLLTVSVSAEGADACPTLRGPGAQAPSRSDPSERAVDVTVAPSTRSDCWRVPT
jgi:hypothetical protein